MSHNDTTSNTPITTNTPPNNIPTPINSPSSTSITTNPYNIKDSIYSYLKLSRCEMALLIYMLFQEETEIEKIIIDKVFNNEVDVKIDSIKKQPS